MGIVIESPVLGSVNVEGDDLYIFAQGIPGFEDSRRFAVLRPDPESPFAYLQSADRPELVLLVANPFFFFPEYDFELPDAAVAELELASPEEAAVWVVITVPEKPEQATANLLAPIVLNARTRRGRQTILTNQGYTTKHPLFETLAAGDAHGGGGGDAGFDAQEG